MLTLITGGEKWWQLTREISSDLCGVRTQDTSRAA